MSELRLLRVSELFPGGVSIDHAVRNEVSDSWLDDDTGLDDLLEDVDEKLMPMMDDLESKLERYLDSRS